MVAAMANSALLVLLVLAAGTLADSGDFGYQSNGADWHAECQTGHSQSPIHLANYTTLGRGNSTYKPLQISYYPVTNFTVSDYGATYKVAGTFGTLRAFTLDKAGEFTFNALQFHFHAPSEHTLDGKYYPLELHIVHMLPSSSPGRTLNLAVIGVFFEEGQENPALAQFTSARPRAIDVRELFGGATELTEYYMYEGSLTTPPCTEAVNWFVLHRPLPASAAQIAFFQHRWQNNFEFAHGKGNNRKIMPRHKREIVRYSKAVWAGVAALALTLGF